MHSPLRIKRRLYLPLTNKKTRAGRCSPALDLSIDHLERKYRLHEDAPCCSAVGEGSSSERRRLAKILRSDRAARRSVINVVEQIQRLRAEAQGVFVAGARSTEHAAWTAASPATAKPARPQASARSTASRAASTRPASATSGRSAIRRPASGFHLWPKTERTAHAQVECERRWPISEIHRRQSFTGLRNRIEASVRSQFILR